MRLTATSTQNLQVQIQAGNHTFLADEPARLGGDDAGPNPYDLLLSALAACKIMTVQLYARRKGWPLETVTVSLDHAKIHAHDCQECTTGGSAKLDQIIAQVSFTGDLDEAQIARLADIAARCPVHRTLTGEINIRTTIV